MPARDTETGTEAEATPRRRRFWLWVCAVVVVFLLLLTPPLLNVNRLQRRIATSISASLGRPVHLDKVTLHLLPTPGFTLQNLVVSEDPAFGAEPIIRANSVDVTLRPSSLWRRHVEFSSISFDQPSLNLVRNAAGEWNVQSLLMHAAQVNTAPTAQRKAGPEPRFPYIEASEARVNVKLGQEKKPFSLTEADFALWLTSPQEWRVRLKGTPTRTDMNISDPGTVRLEGSLKRAATMAEVPIDLTASWSGAPLGEASKLLMGADAEWRGNLSANATLAGTLGAAKLRTTIHLEDLRRATFIPIATMDVQADCRGTLNVTTAVLNDPDCSVGTPQAEGVKVAGRVVAIADSVDLSTVDMSDLRVGMTSVPDAWLLDWARLFSQRIPAGERPGGTIAGSVLFGSAKKGQPAQWQGAFHGEIDGPMPWKPVENGFTVHPISVTTSTAATGGSGEFALTPLRLTAPGKLPELTLSGTATRRGYTLTLVGEATSAQLAELRAIAPPLGDGLLDLLKLDAPAKSAQGSVVEAAALARAIKVDVTCARPWGGSQTCTEAAPATPKRRRRRF
ncbi:MAG: AsmA family protein [Acidobacteriaceae bacterium]